jgi:hypothetical protein
MTIISISEAAKLTKKSRRTLQRHIGAGKLSKTMTVTGEEGIDTSELIRAYGEFKSDPVTHIDAASNNASMSQADILYDAEKEALKNEIEKLTSLLTEKEERLKDKQAHIDSLNHALLLLEHKPQATPSPKEEKPIEATKKSLWNWFKK